MIFHLAEFWEGLGVTEAHFDLPDRRVMEGNNAGDVAPIQIGQRKWRGTVSIRPYRHADAREVKAKIEAMKEADSLFLLSPSDRQPAGQTGTLASVESDRRLITLNDISVSVGDYIAFTDGTVRSLHSVVRNQTGDGGGVSPYVTVVPPLPLAIGVGDDATCDTPTIKARIAADTSGPSFGAAMTAPFSFSFSQVLT